MITARSDDTIVGVATGTPDGGVAIVRLSGARAREIAQAVVGSLPPARVLARRRVALGSAAGDAEAALVVVMPAPASYTGEDVVELHVHAGKRNVGRVVERLLEAGAVAAGPGDFTRRAFVHGRMTLDQAEGVAALIGARTDAALSQARRLAAGEVGRAVERTSRELGELRAEIEAHLDFPEALDDADTKRWAAKLGAAADAVARWVAGFEAGRRARERARFVLAGPTNAGKSALFNALLGRTRALVSEQPGTTRDYVEAELELGPHTAVLVDTAGLRSSEDAIEIAGIALGREQVEGADVLVWVEGADAEERDGTPDGERGTATVVRVETKRDLGARRPGWIGVSAKTGAGLEALRERLHEWFAAGSEEAWIGLARHHERAREALGALREAAAELAGAAALELVAFQLGVAQARLGEITGRTALGPVGEDVLERIFARFCIGK